MFRAAPAIDGTAFKNDLDAIVDQQIPDRA
jgi:hypothetical protein